MPHHKAEHDENQDELDRLPERAEQLEESGLVDYEGTEREGGDDEMSNHMGAVETEVEATLPPTTGPADVDDGPINPADIDPREELTGG